MELLYYSNKVKYVAKY